MGFGEEVLSSVVEALADLHAAKDIPYAQSDRDTYSSHPLEIYWPYPESILNLLREMELLDLGSHRDVYPRDPSSPIWRYVGLSKKGMPYAREAYLRRLKSNEERATAILSSPEFRHVVPFVVYGAIKERKDGSYILSKVPRGVERALSDLESELSFKADVKPQPPVRRTTVHTIDELWEMMKGTMSGRRFDLLGRFFWFLSGLSPVVMRVNSLMSELGKMRLVLTVPFKVSGRVDTDLELWVFPDELMDFLSQHVDHQMVARLRDHVVEFSACLASYLGRRWRKGQLLRVFEVLSDENPDLALSPTELEAALISLIDSINEANGSVSKYNLAGDDDSKPFVVMDSNAFIEALAQRLTNLALDAMREVSL